MTKKAKKHPKLNKAIDTFISALKIAGSSDLFLGIFIILEGLSLIFVPTLFPIFIALSILIAFAFAVELFFDLARRKRTVRSVLHHYHARHCVYLLRSHRYLDLPPESKE